jgi:hypothetical protein
MMADSTATRMLQLSQIIAAKTAFVCSPKPTAEEPDPAETLKKARLELVDATDELNYLAKDPKDALQSLAWSVSMPLLLSTHNLVSSFVLGFCPFYVHDFLFIFKQF